MNSPAGTVKNQINELLIIKNGHKSQSQGYSLLLS